jgi:UDPglucose 6-dehydrogenase
MKKVCMIGTGYVGLVTGTCFAELGHRVICVDKDEKKINELKHGHIPIYEPGLDKIVKKNRAAKRLSFTTSIKEGVTSSDLIFIAVNTPPLPNGGADLSYVEACTREVAHYANGYKLLVEKSTVPVQTGDRIKKTLGSLGQAAQKIEIASNPEFLREGSAIEDFLKPDRIVIGVSSKKAEKHLRELYSKIKAPMVVTDINSAELIKHASNSFLAMKISYINAIAQLCEKVGADVSKVAEGMGLDRRIGKSFLNAGIGYGGSCFPKDVSAFIKIAEKNGYQFDLLRATEDVNSAQRRVVVKKVEEALWTLRGKTIAVWGLAFKPNTDDLRNAPAIDIINELLAGGSTVKAYDPVAMDRMKSLFPSIEYASSALDAVKGADALMIVTEWDEFKKVNLEKVKKALKMPLVVDGRNLFLPESMAARGFFYHSIGRGFSGAPIDSRASSASV